MNTKNIVIAILALVLIGAVSYLIINSNDTVVLVEDSLNTEDKMPVEPAGGIGDGAQPLDQVLREERGSESVIGTSVNGSEIVAYHFGDGEEEVLLVGGVHGGYSPNTAALAAEFVEYFKDNESVIPDNVTVTVIPTLNPDGITKTGDAGRFNSNNVDLNRNFDCDWSAEAVWQNEKVSGGTKAFSEPEADAFREYIEKYDPTAAVVWFSAEGKVYPSACDGTPSKASTELAATYAASAGYPAEAKFNAYAITGDMVNWMAKQGIPAISVLLSDHRNTEWAKNLEGVKAVLNTYAE